MWIVLYPYKTPHSDEAWGPFPTIEEADEWRIANTPADDSVCIEVKSGEQYHEGA